MTTSETSAGVLQTFRESPFAVKALLAGVLVNKLGSFVQVFLVLFMTTRGFTEVQAGFALSAYGAGSVLGVLAGGSFTDRVGARTTIVVGMGGTAVFLVAVVYLRHYAAMLVVVTVVGAISQLYRPASAALLSEYIHVRRQVMVFAMYRLALNIGTTAAPLLGALLVSVSYDLLFWGEALAALSYAVIALFALPKREKVTARPAAEPSNAGGYLTVLTDRRYLAYLLAMLINAVVYVQYMSSLPLAMKAQGFETFWYGVMVALNGFIVICFELVANTIVQRWPVRIVLAVGFTLLGVGLAFYALPGGLVVFAIGTLIWSIAEIVEGATMFAYPVRLGDERSRGRYVGAAHAMLGIGSAIGPAVGVALWNGLGNQFWLICGVTSVLALIPGWWGSTSESLSGHRSKE
jgi:MFS family permease